jgi:membrane-bound lytic murein transglycosylase D
MRIAAIVLVLPLALGGCAVPWVRSPPESDAREAGATQRVATQPAVAAPVRQAPPNAPDVTRPADLWQHLASEFRWRTATDHAAVRAEIARLNRRPKSFRRAAAAAEPYLWHIVDQLRQRNMPLELALIPMVESRFRSAAISPYGAAGLWQFMPDTGRRFGLKQTRWYDARLDPIASTRAALDYLERLRDQFDGDWLLAIAAYNCGPATVRRALARRAADDFWSIADALPTETRVHVPRLLAVIDIIAQRDGSNITVEPIPNEPYFERVDLGGPLDLEYLRERDERLRDTFETLNAAHRRRYTDPDGPFRILVPRPLLAPVTMALAEVPAQRRAATRLYVVRAGDTLGEIARTCDIPVRVLRRHNGLAGNLIRPGQELIVPAIAGQADPDIAPPVSEHVVVTGESLWTIARRFKVTIDELRRWNDLPRRRPLQPGQSLIVSRPDSSAARNI